MSSASPKSPLRVLYATTYDPEDVHAFSGGGRRILLALRDSFEQVGACGLLRHRKSWRSWANKALKGLGSSSRFDDLRTHANARAFAAQTLAWAQRFRPDVILSQGVLPIAYLETRTPIVNWTDAVWSSVADYSARYASLKPEFRRAAHEIEGLALQRCDLLALQSDYAAPPAVRDYGFPEERIRVVPFGANADSGWNREDALKAVDGKLWSRCNLLFVGVEWERKGASFAIQVAQALASSGTSTRLWIVGCRPPRGAIMPTEVEIVGFLRRSDPDQAARLRELFESAHFFILPTRAESGGNAFVEASS